MRLAGIGAYAPGFRLPAAAIEAALDSFKAPGIQSVAIPNSDEDAITMAWEASTRALDAADIPPTELEGVFLASTTLPTQDESQVPHLVTALGAPGHVDAREFTASTAGAGEALASAATFESGPVLVVASDTPSGSPDSPEGHAAGAGAGAIVLSSGGTGAITEYASATCSYPGTRFRPSDSETTGLGITEYDRESMSTTLKTALEGVTTTDIDAVALTMPDGKRPYRAARTAGLEPSLIADTETVSTLGDSGTASPFLGLARAILVGRSSILLAAYGSGATCHAFTIDTGVVPVNAALEATIELDYTTAERLRGTFSSGRPAGGGANIPLPTYTRSLAQRYRLTAGECRSCGELVFPPENACPTCTATQGYDKVEATRNGRVVAVTEIGTGGAPPEFVDYQNRSGTYATAIIEMQTVDDRTFDVPLQVLLENDSETVENGGPVRTVFRRLYIDQGVHRYGLKAIQSD